MIRITPAPQFSSHNYSLIVRGGIAILTIVQVKHLGWGKVKDLTNIRTARKPDPVQELLVQ